MPDSISQIQIPSKRFSSEDLIRLNTILEPKAVVVAQTSEQCIVTELEKTGTNYYRYPKTALKLLKKIGYITEDQYQYFIDKV